MAGGTLCSTEKGFTVRVPELRSSTTLAVTRCEKRGKAVLCLDNAFSLIEGHPSGLKAYSIFGENEDVVFIGGYSHDEQAPMEKNHGHRSICKPTLAYTRPLEFVTNEPAIAKRA